jgi:hypothetical protein
MPLPGVILRRNHPAHLALAAWFLAIGAGLLAFHRYAGTPGPSSAGAAEWPASSALDAPGSSRVIAFLHPKCACSDATLTELLGVLEDAPDGTSASVVFVRSSPDVPASSPLVSRAERARSVRVLFDDGTEARRFGAETSGHVLAFRDGRAVFRGGVTGTRGHVGPNPGARALAAALRADAHDSPPAPVFGCGLFGERDR